MFATLRPNGKLVVFSPFRQLSVECIHHICSAVDKSWVTRRHYYCWHNLQLYDRDVGLKRDDKKLNRFLKNGEPWDTPRFLTCSSSRDSTRGFRASIRLTLSNKSSTRWFRDSWILSRSLRLEICSFWLTSRASRNCIVSSRTSSLVSTTGWQSSFGLEGSTGSDFGCGWIDWDCVVLRLIRLHVRRACMGNRMRLWKRSSVAHTNRLHVRWGNR